MKPNAYVTNIRDQRELRNKASRAHQILQISCPMGPHISDLSRNPNQGPRCEWALYIRVSVERSIDGTLPGVGDRVLKVGAGAGSVVTSGSNDPAGRPMVARPRHGKASRIGGTYLSETTEKRQITPKTYHKTPYRMFDPSLFNDLTNIARLCLLTYYILWV